MPTVAGSIASRSSANLRPGLATSRRGAASRGLTLRQQRIETTDARTKHLRHHAFDVMIEIDSDGHRSGVRAGDRLLIDIARELAGGGAILKGVLTHAGSSYDLNGPETLQQLAEQERREIVAAAGQLRAAGFPCPEVSVGSTPTALSAMSLPDITEVRAGVYVFFDLFMTNVGVCAIDDIALSVLTTVVGHQSEKGWIIVDAGWMAMSRDRGTARQAHDYGYGAVCDVQGDIIEGYTVSAANQEHGIISRAEGVADQDIARRFPIGSLLRILPNHACITAAAYDRYHVLDGSRIIAEWERVNRW